MQHRRTLYSSILVLTSLLLCACASKPTFIIEQTNNIPADLQNKTYAAFHASRPDLPELRNHYALLQEKLKEHGWQKSTRDNPANYTTSFNYYLLEGAYPDNPHRAYSERYRINSNLSREENRAIHDRPVDTSRKDKLYTKFLVFNISDRDFVPGKQKHLYQAKIYLIDYNTDLNTAIPQLIEYFFEYFPGKQGESTIRKKISPDKPFASPPPKD